MVSEIEQLDHMALERLCRRYNVHRLAIFGSVARGEARPDSDVDLLVDFEPDSHPTFFSLGALAEELQPLFGGRNVDLVIRQSLHWFIRDQVIESARTVYPIAQAKARKGISQ